MRRDPRIALFAALGCVLALVATGVAFLLWPQAQARDSLALASLNVLDRDSTDVLLNAVVHLCDPQPYGLFGLGLIAIAFARGRRRLALALPFLLLASAATTQVLKPLLATDRADAWLQSNISAASWPSGHATAAMTLALAAVLVAPRRLRPAVAVLGAGFAVAVASGIVILAWHFPSDVLGGFLVAATWTLLVVAVLLWAERRRPGAAAPRARERPAGPVADRGRGSPPRSASRWPSRWRAPTRSASTRSTTRRRWRRSARSPRSASRSPRASRGRCAASAAPAPRAQVRLDRDRDARGRDRRRAVADEPEPALARAEGDADQERGLRVRRGAAARRAGRGCARRARRRRATARARGTSPRRRSRRGR